AAGVVELKMSDVPHKGRAIWRVEMEGVQSIAILVVAATAFWAFLALRKRIEFLEHEVRWLRSEFNNVRLIDTD
ncbi:MAG: hypothetical protein PVH83_11580, partial [Methyloceanibacter sp.]